MQNDLPNLKNYWKMTSKSQFNVPPMSIITTENIFSQVVFAETLPKPTVVSDVQE